MGEPRAMTTGAGVAWSRQPRWTDAQLRDAIARSTSFRDAATRLGAVETRKRVRRRTRELHIDTTHFKSQRDKARRWTDGELRAAVVGARSIADVLRALGLRAAGGNFDHVRRRIEALEIDTSHILGQGWNVGRSPGPKRPLEEILVAGRWTSTHSLKLRLFREGLKTPRCEICGWAQQAADGRIPVELDHVNGDRNDNRIENLRVLCPNCHSLQPTHRGLNRKDLLRRR